MESTYPVRIVPRDSWGREKRGDNVDLFDPCDFEPRIRTSLLVLQPTPFCNLNCDYCYLPDRNNRARMTLATVRLAIRRLVDDELTGAPLTIVWHAGEPLTLSPSYYEEAFEVVAEELRPGEAATHSIQTNATLIDDRWCNLFRKHGVQIGVSIDGPAFIHDLHRKTRGSKGSHALVLRGLQMLRRHGIDHYAIAVITADSLRYADAIRAFFAEQGIDKVGLNFDEAEGVHRNSSLAGCDESHRDFLERMLDHMLESDGTFRVRELINVFDTIRSGIPTYRWRGRELPLNVQTMPFALITVGWNGDFSTFSPELAGQADIGSQSFLFGNVERSGYIASTTGLAFKGFWAAVRGGVEACRDKCAYFQYCGGGSPGNKLYETGSARGTETLYCRAMLQRPFDTVLSRLEYAGFS